MVGRSHSLSRPSHPLLVASAQPSPARSGDGISASAGITSVADPGLPVPDRADRAGDDPPHGRPCPTWNPPPSASEARPTFSYRSWASFYDEMTTDVGQIRPHWRAFADQIEGLGLAELRQRWNEARNLIRENGVTYNVYGDPQGMDRPWELDPIPLLIAPGRRRRARVGADPAGGPARPCPGRPPRAATSPDRPGSCRRS